MAKKKTPGNKDGDWDPADTCDVPIPQLIEAVKREGVMSYDLETTGLDPRRDRIEGVAFYVPNEKDPTEPPLRAWYPFVDGTMNHTVDAVVRPLRERIPQRETMEQLRELWHLEDVVAIRHNGSFDDAFLYLQSGLEENLVIKNIIADSMLADYVADERRKRYGLKLRVEQVFSHKMTSYKEAAGGQASFGFAKKKPLGVYAVEDTAWTYRLFKWAIEQIRLQDPPKEHKNSEWCSPLDDTPGVYSDLEKIFWKIEMKIQRVLMEMELTGCFIDWEWLVQVQERVQRQQEEILAEFKETVGWVPNLRSPKQVSDFLYKPPADGGLGVPTKGVDYNEDLDQYATGDKALKHRKQQYPLVGKLLKYRSLSVIDNSFCKKLIGIAQEDDNQRVHARFRQTGTVIGRLSCISENTPIEVVRDVSKNPRGIPIEDVVGGDLVYTYDNELNLTLRPVKKAWKTGHRKVVRVHWRSAHGRRGYVDVTPEHPIRLIDGSYQKAEALTEGDRCLALGRNNESYPYAHLYPTGHPEISAEHRWIYETVNGPVGEKHVHHKDGNKLNNRLGNLEPLAPGVHLSHHAKEMWKRPETREAITAAVESRWDDPDYRTKHHEHMKQMWRDGKFVKPSGRDHPQYKKIAKEWIEEELKRHGGSLTNVARANTINYDRLKRFIKEYGIEIKDCRHNFLYRKDGTPITRGDVARARKAPTQREAFKTLGVSNFYKFQQLQEHFGFYPVNNHTIVKVEDLPDPVDVYDLEIEGTHNFIAGELCVHNSADPVNLMNQPRDKDLIRKAFCAHLEDDHDPERSELCLIDADYCLVAGTPIITVDGIMPIEEVAARAPAVVSSADGKSIEIRPVVAGGCVGKAPCVRVTLEDGSAVVCTEDHKWMTYGGQLVETKYLNPGDRLAHVISGRLGRYKTWRIKGATAFQHIMLAEHFHGPRPPAHDVDHTNADVDDNSRTNLRWLPSGENRGQAARRWWAAATERQRAAKTESLVEGQRKNRRSYKDDGNPNFGKLKGTVTECLSCGKGFYRPPSTDSKYCSRECYHKSRENGCELVCERCDLPFYRSDGRKTRFCSRECFTANKPTEINCEVCGTTFLPTKKIARFCGTACSNRSRGKTTYSSKCARCKEMFESTRRTAKYCGRECWKLRAQPVVGNHRIISIEPVGVREVWQITVEGTHTYVLENGLISGQSQMELRMAGHLANESNIIEVFLNVTGCHSGENGGPCDRYTWYECFSCHEKAPPKMVHGSPACQHCNAMGGLIEHQKRCRHVDLHQRTAEDVGVPRQLAKSQNFGLLYRMGAPKFCTYAGLFDEHGNPQLDYGQELIEKWHAAYPGIAAWHERTIQQLLRDNYIAYNIARRRRRLDQEWRINDYRAGTQAIQFRVSGSCQDLIKLAMIKIFDTRNAKVANCRPAEAKLWAQYKFLIQVHDELIFQGPKALKEELCALVKDCMEGAAQGLRVPFTADARAGRTWEELH